MRHHGQIFNEDSPDDIDKGLSFPENFIEIMIFRFESPVIFHQMSSMTLFSGT